MTSAEQEDPSPLAILDDYDFELPESSIAQAPAAERDSARLLVLDGETGKILESGPDHRVRDLTRWLRRGDLLVMNSTRVRSARLVGRKVSGGAAEALLLGPDVASESSHRALIKCTGRIREGLAFHFGPNSELDATITAIHERGEVTLRFASEVDPYAHGQPPLPPYIRRPSAQSAEDLERYQTIYAKEPGAIAAPTAGLHFTVGLFQDLEEAGIRRTEVVLHVGAGTFRPLEARSMLTGRLHPEEFILSAQTAAAINQTRANGGRIIAVGTTTARVLESQTDADGNLQAGSGTTDLFIRPGGPPFRSIDALLTNFHLPRSSLLLLVAEFVGRRAVLDAYAHAIREGFRFYSYGDAMLVLGRKQIHDSESKNRSDDQ
jgi:S-adenosylmethionine:tRNA ribosyltransferase-isomerase